MPPEERLPEQLDLIIGHIDNIERRLAGLDIAAFSESSDELDLTAFRLSQIGELTHHLAPSLKEVHPEIDWPRLRKLRNMIAHEYARTSIRQMWEIATGELKDLHAFCIAELARLGE